MPYRYTLRTPDGDDPGAIVLDRPATTGEEIQVSGHLRMLVRTVVPTPPSEEFVDIAHGEPGQGREFIDAGVVFQHLLGGAAGPVAP